MSLSAFTPFYRNHNSRGAIGQEPWRWETGSYAARVPMTLIGTVLVASSSRKAIATRYSLLPYWVRGSLVGPIPIGTPPIRALFFEFPTDPELFGVDRQFMIGRDLLVTPVLAPNVTSVQGVFPGKGKVIWRDWYTHEMLDTSHGSQITLSAPLEHINVHVREGAIILLHSKPGYSIAETRTGPYSLLVSLTSDGYATGSAFIDDGESLPPTPHRILQFAAARGQLTINVGGSYEVKQRIDAVTILGVATKPHLVLANGLVQSAVVFQPKKQKLLVHGLSLDINEDIVIQWA